MTRCVICKKDTIKHDWDIRFRPRRKNYRLTHICIACLYDIIRDNEDVLSSLYEVKHTTVVELRDIENIKAINDLLREDAIKEIKRERKKIIKEIREDFPWLEDDF